MKAPFYPRLFSVDEFKSAATGRDGKILPVRKQLAGVFKGEAEGGMSFILSTATADRTGDTVAVGGWDLANYKKNPVVLWAHDYSHPPVGTCGYVGPEGDALLAKNVRFMEREVSEFAWSVGEMYKRGYLNAVSVGFRPKKYNLNSDTGGVDFQEQELLEFSAVPVPANPEALVAAKSAGIPLDGFLRWAEEILETANEPEFQQKLLVPKQYVEQLRRSIASPFVQVRSIEEEPMDDEGEDELVECMRESTLVMRELLGAVKELSVALKDAGSKSATPAPVTGETSQTQAPKAEAPTLTPQPASEPVDLAKAVADVIRKQLAELK